jgi:replication factor A1
VKFHYALVDDLLTREEFERRVEEKMQECGDLLDEESAAMLVVGECGRQHVKIAGLTGRSSLYCFFGRVLSRTDPREFERRDGEKGYVATVVVGDETGQTRVALWDERAMAVGEIEPGEVLEVIGRPSGRAGAITALALRKAAVDIVCTDAPIAADMPVPVRLDLDVRLIAAGEVRTFTRKDGSTGEIVEALVGYADGCARLSCWAPALLGEIPSGSVIRITGALERDRGRGKEYSIDERSSVSLLDREISVPLSPIGSIGDGGMFSVAGTVRSAGSPREFTGRDGTPSLVRNLVVADESGEIRVALWGDQARRHFFPGDWVTVYHAAVRVGRNGERELSASRGSAVILTECPPTDITVTGCVIATEAGTFLDDGRECYLAAGDLPHGRQVRISGTVRGRRITVSEMTGVDLDPAPLLAASERIRDGTDRS